MDATFPEWHPHLNVCLIQVIGPCHKVLIMFKITVANIEESRNRQLSEEYATDGFSELAILWEWDCGRWGAM